MWALLLNRYVIGAAAIAVALTLAFGAGYSRASKACRAEQLQAELATVKRDAAIAAASARLADVQLNSVKEQRDALQTANDRYEADLVQRQGPRCTRTPDDDRGMRELLKKAAP